MRPKTFYYTGWSTFFYVLVIFTIMFGGCFRGILASENKAVRALETYGFSDIKIIKKSWFAIPLRGGGGEDCARFTAQAINPAGKKVEVYVYSGWPFKGATVRVP